MPDKPQRFEPSLDGLPEAVIAATLTGEILFWNRAAETIFGIPRKAAVGRQVVDTIVAPDDLEDARGKLASAIAAGAATFEYVCQRRACPTSCSAFATSPSRNTAGRRRSWRHGSGAFWSPLPMPW